MRTSYGDMDIAIPRDRKGEYEPQLIPKYQNTVTQDMEEKIISMYAKGMTTGDIEAHLKELYDLDISDSTISRITDKIMPLVKEWKERPLQEIYAVVYMDAIHYHVRSEGRIVKRAVYIALGIDMDGKFVHPKDHQNNFPFVLLFPDLRDNQYKCCSPPR